MTVCDDFYHDAYTPCISAPLRKKISAGILDKSQREPGKAQNLAGTSAELCGDFSGKGRKFSGNSSSSGQEPGIDPNSARISAGRGRMP